MDIVRIDEIQTYQELLMKIQSVVRYYVKEGDRIFYKKGNQEIDVSEEKAKYIKETIDLYLKISDFREETEKRLRKAKKYYEASESLDIENELEKALNAKVVEEVDKILKKREVDKNLEEEIR